jgi:hypothetical protein
VAATTPAAALALSRVRRRRVNGLSVMGEQCPRVGADRVSGRSSGRRTAR